MTSHTPLWTAERLHAALSESFTEPVGLTTRGIVSGLKGSTGYKAEGGAARIAVIQEWGEAWETMALNLRMLPPSVVLRAVDPEPWCNVIVYPGALDAVGPFNDVPSPLWEWLLRAASIGVVEYTAGARENRSPRSPRLPELVPGTVPADRRWLAAPLDRPVSEIVGGAVTSSADAVALSAGLWQMNDFLDRSHQLSQSIEGEGKHSAGDYWHAINHRREPDYGNSKYWFRRVGRHAIFPALAEESRHVLAGCKAAEAEDWAARLTGRGWDPFAFVDLCEAAVRERDSELAEAARTIQLVEMTLLLASTYHDAVA